MAIYCNTLKGNTQYGIDPYCYIPRINTSYIHYQNSLSTCEQQGETFTVGIENRHLWENLVAA